MPRPMRLQYPGAWHHVMNRGAARQDIYLSRADREMFLSLLGDAVKKFGIEVHAYALMNNHYHLMVRTPEPNLDLAIHHLASNYVRTFNQRAGRDGPLFRARFTSLVIETDAYRAAVSRYIHRNPVDLGVENLARYEWSSYGSYVAGRRKQRWLTKRDTLDQLGGSSGYRAFVEGPFDGQLEEIYRRRKLPHSLGDREADETPLAAAA